VKAVPHNCESCGQPIPNPKDEVWTRTGFLMCRDCERELMEREEEEGRGDDDRR
jgi:hypothetical protein